jgi:hypothetical protein
MSESLVRFVERSRLTACVQLSSCARAAALTVPDEYCRARLGPIEACPRSPTD